MGQQTKSTAVGEVCHSRCPRRHFDPAARFRRARAEHLAICAIGFVAGGKASLTIIDSELAAPQAQPVGCDPRAGDA